MIERSDLGLRASVFPHVVAALSGATRRRRLDGRESDCITYLHKEADGVHREDRLETNGAMTSCDLWVRVHRYLPRYIDDRVTR